MSSLRDASTVVYQDFPGARSEVLLLASSSWAFFGMYLAVLFLTVVDATRDKRAKHFTTIHSCGGLSDLSAVLTVVKHLTVAIGASDACTWTQARTVPSGSSTGVYTTLCGGPLYGSTYILVLLLVGLYVPPIITFLTDGILAWRVYVVWNRPRWLLFVLPIALSVDCGIGLYVAAGATLRLEDYHSVVIKSHLSLFGLYSSWAWVAFALNSALSVSILVRMRHEIADFGRKQPGWCRTVMSALIESAILSWIGTLSSAAAWANNSPRPSNSQHANGFLDPIAPQTALEKYRTFVFVALPYLLAISQVLIILRVNIAKFKTTHAFCRSITAAPLDSVLYGPTATEES